MKKSHLARKLSEVEDFENPRVSLEQYLTPPELAADIIHTAFMQGDIEGRKLVDLGTGTGIFAIGAALNGAEEIVAVEKDREAIDKARENAEELGVKEQIRFIEEDIEKFEGSADTVLMNPPFSVHSDSGIKFFEKAIKISDNVYSVAHPGARKSIKDFVENSDHTVVMQEEYSISLPATYGFHTQEGRETDVDVFVTRKQKG